MKYIKLFEDYNNDLIVYHGTDDLHDFSRRGEFFNGTFFSTNPNEAQTYGQHIYECELKNNLILFDSFKDKDLRFLLKVFGELYDTHYEEGESGYLITKPSQMKFADNWNPIEKLLVL